jgi:hypothetical protein
MPHPIRPLLTLCSLLLLALHSPPRLQAWRFEEERLHPAAPSAPLVPMPAPPADLDGDGQDETLSLQDGRAVIARRSQVLWQSPAAWQVVQVGLADLNRDRTPEAVLLLWRPFQPWPVDAHLPHPGRIAGFHDQRGMSCHLILIGWQQGEYRERWAGSALAEPLVAFLPVDLDGDGYPELAAIENFYDDPAFLPGRAVAVWQWNGFGFSLLDRRRGAFSALSAARTPQDAVVLLTGH